MACQNERAVCPCHRSISAYTVRVRVAFKKGDARRSPSAARDQVGYIPKDIVGAVATLIGRPVLVPIARRATNRLNYSLDSSSLEFSFFFFHLFSLRRRVIHVRAFFDSFLTQRRPFVLPFLIIYLHFFSHRPSQSIYRLVAIRIACHSRPTDNMKSKLSLSLQFSAPPPGAGLILLYMYYVVVIVNRVATRMTEPTTGSRRRGKKKKSAGNADEGPGWTVDSSDRCWAMIISCLFDSIVPTLHSLNFQS